MNPKDKHKVAETRAPGLKFKKSGRSLESSGNMAELCKLGVNGLADSPKALESLWRVILGTTNIQLPFLGGAWHFLPAKGWEGIVWGASCTLTILSKRKEHRGQGLERCILGACKKCILLGALSTTPNS